MTCLRHLELENGVENGGDFEAQLQVQSARTSHLSRRSHVCGTMSMNSGISSGQYDFRK